jgi:hypothetical protein
LKVEKARLHQTLIRCFTLGAIGFTKLALSAIVVVPCRQLCLGLKNTSLTPLRWAAFSRLPSCFSYR